MRLRNRRRVSRFGRSGLDYRSIEDMLTEDELAPSMGGRGGFGGGRGPGGRFGGRGGAGQGGLDDDVGSQMATRIFNQNDRDKDGKLTGDEIPDRMKQNLERVDTNEDGVVDKAEVERMFNSGGPGGGQRPNAD